MADEAIETTDTTPMDDKTTNTDATPDTANKTVLDTPTPFINPDGTFLENWKESLPEDIRNEDCWKTVTDFKNMATQFVHQRKAIGKDKVTLPGPNATEKEWGLFYATIGRPATPNDYKVDVPEELGEIFTPERVTAAKEMAHTMGITDKQFDAYMKHEMENTAAIIKQQEEQRIAAKDSVERDLKREFGQAYDERMAVAKKLVTDTMPQPEARMAFLQKFGSDPDFIRFASAVGGRLVESSAMVAELTQDTPGDAMKKVSQLQQLPGYMVDDGKMTAEQRNAITDQIRELYRIAKPEPARQSAYVGLGR